MGNCCGKRIGLSFFATFDTRETILTSKYVFNAINKNARLNPL